MIRLPFPIATLTIFLAYFSQVISKNDNTLFAVIGKYPGYSANLNPSGKVTINFKDSGGFTLGYNLKGLNSDCNGKCGIHIHEGTTCEKAKSVGGHYYRPIDNQTDPWNNNITYRINENGIANSMFDFDSGIGYEDIIGHVVVVHSFNSSRVGCGLIEKTRNKKKTYFIPIVILMGSLAAISLLMFILKKNREKSRLRKSMDLASKKSNLSLSTDSSKKGELI